MKRKIYVMCGSTPKDWQQQEPLGPFESENKACAAIREDIQRCTNSEMLSPGKDETYCEEYHLLEYVKGFKPVLDVKVDISLSNIKNT